MPPNIPSADPLQTSQTHEALPATQAADPPSYPVGLACTTVEIHEYPAGVRIRPFTITPPGAARPTPSTSTTNRSANPNSPSAKSASAAPPTPGTSTLQK